MLTVACVLKSGGIYDASWVARLKAGVAKHLPIEHRFVCLSDVDVPCERIPLQRDWPGWWSKVEMFGIEMRGPLLYFDLDTAIVGDLTEIARMAAEQSFVMLRDFYRPEGLGSGVMGWRDMPPRLRGTFAYDAREIMQKCASRGDQGFLEDCDVRASRWQDIVGDQIVSYKVHCHNGIPPSARVVCLHGLPKFADMPPSDPVRLVWERAA